MGLALKGLSNLLDFSSIARVMFKELELLNILFRLELLWFTALVKINKKMEYVASCVNLLC